MTAFRLAEFGFELLRQCVPALKNLPRLQYELETRSALLKLEERLEQEFVKREIAAFDQGRWCSKDHAE
jgi:hypothetical protein